MEFFDVDNLLRSFVDLLDAKLKKEAEVHESQFEWLLSFPETAREQLNTGGEDENCFKMPKTPALKTSRKQKKRVFADDEDSVPSKKEKLCFDEEEEEAPSLRSGGRPRRQASSAAETKIKKSLKMMNQKHKLRQTSDGRMSMAEDSSIIEASPEMKAPVDSALKKSKGLHVTLQEDAVAPSTPVSIPEKPIRKVGFPKAPESEPEPKQTKATRSKAAKVEVEEAPAEVEKQKRSRATRSKAEVDPEVEVESRRTKTTRAKAEADPEPSTPALRRKKSTDAKNEPELLQCSEPEAPSAEESKRSTRSKVRNEVTAPPKKTRPFRKTKTSALSVAAATPGSPHRPTPSPRIPPTSPAPSAHRPNAGPSTPARTGKAPAATANNSPLRKMMFTPKLVFSPFKASSVKTKVEAFEAVFSGPNCQAILDDFEQKTRAVLPEARVVVRRLTSEQIQSVIYPPKTATSDADDASAIPAADKRGTFVMPKNAKEVKRTTFVVDESPDKTCGAGGSNDSGAGVARTLARKSLDRAKHMALSAARQKFINSTLTSDATAGSVPGSPATTHLNRNASAIISKYRFTNPSTNSSGSSSGTIRHVAMTQARLQSASGTSSASGSTKSQVMVPVVTKANDEEEMRMKEEKLAKLRMKEEEAARKREELNKAKAEEQRRKHDARAKRAMEQRALRVKKLEEEQRLKVESKEEKCANIKLDLQAHNQEKALELKNKNQEKAEKIKTLLLQRQQEAEQKRRLEEQQRLREKEEEQRLLALKKEQERLLELAEQERVRQAELEKSKKAVVSAAPAKTLNTTITLPSTDTVDNYQITPVRVNKVSGKVNPDNYDIGDMRSDDSTDDDSRPKKVIPNWARTSQLKYALAAQHTGEIDTDAIFPASVLRLDPNLNEIFKIKRARFDKRTSSAVWKTPPSKYI